MTNWETSKSHTSCNFAIAISSLQRSSYFSTNPLFSTFTPPIFQIGSSLSIFSSGSLFFFHFTSTLPHLHFHVNFSIFLSGYPKIFILFIPIFLSYSSEYLFICDSYSNCNTYHARSICCSAIQLCDSFLVVFSEGK